MPGHQPALLLPAIVASFEPRPGFMSRSALLGAKASRPRPSARLQREVPRRTPQGSVAPVLGDSQVTQRCRDTHDGLPQLSLLARCRRDCS